MQYRNKRSIKPAVTVCFLLCLICLITLFPIILYITKVFTHKIVFALYSAVFASSLASLLTVLSKFIVYDYIYVLTDDDYPQRFEIYRFSSFNKTSKKVFSHIITKEDNLITPEKKNKTKRNERKKLTGEIQSVYICELFSKNKRYFSFIRENESEKTVCIVISVGDDFADILKATLDNKKQ